VKVPNRLTLLLWEKHPDIRRLVVGAHLSDRRGVFWNESWRNTVLRENGYSSLTRAYVDLLATRLRRSLPSLHVDHGSYTSSTTGACVRWWGLVIRQPSRFSVYLESQSFESGLVDPPSTTLKCELSLRFIPRPHFVGLTTSLRSLLTSVRSSRLRRHGQSQTSPSSTTQTQPRWLYDSSRGGRISPT
jgi:hypothetical protein